VGALEDPDEVVVAREHERGGREQPEVLRAERRLLLVGPREKLERVVPGPPLVGVPASLEQRKVGRRAHAAHYRRLRASPNRRARLSERGTTDRGR
jgi:hypothetical protein